MLNGVVITQDAVKDLNAMLFDGTVNSYVIIPPITFGGFFTISYFLKINQIDQTAGIVDFGDAGGGA